MTPKPPARRSILTHYTDTFAYDAANDLLAADVGGVDLDYSSAGLGRQVSRTADAARTDFWFDATGMTLESGASDLTYLRDPSGPCRSMTGPTCSTSGVIAWARSLPRRTTPRPWPPAAPSSPTAAPPPPAAASRPHSASSEAASIRTPTGTPSASAPRSAPREHYRHQPLRLCRLQPHHLRGSNRVKPLQPRTDCSTTRGDSRSGVSVLEFDLRGLRTCGSADALMARNHPAAGAAVAG